MLCRERETVTAVPPVRFSSLAAFLAQRESVRGTVEVDVGGYPLHFFYDWRDAATTLVTFSGTVSSKVEHVPAWAGDGISRGLGMNRVLISDPSVKLSTDLRLGWYAGNARQPNLQDVLTRLIDGLHSPERRLILFGPSGGGFAALLQASVIPGSVALVSNPQTDITRFTRAAVDRYLSRAWGRGGGADDVWSRLPFVHEVVTLYAAPGSSRTIYLQNAGDADHIERHYAPFRRSVSPDREVEYLLPNLGPGHIGPDKETFRRLLKALRDTRSWDDLRDEIHSIPLTRNL